MKTIIFIVVCIMAFIGGVLVIELMNPKRHVEPLVVTQQAQPKPIPYNETWECGVTDVLIEIQTIVNIAQTNSNFTVLDGKLYMAIVRGRTNLAKELAERKKERDARDEALKSIFEPQTIPPGRIIWK